MGNREESRTIKMVLSWDSGGDRMNGNKGGGEGKQLRKEYEGRERMRYFVSKGEGGDHVWCT